jgi:hypothetical protein
MATAKKTKAATPKMKPLPKGFKAARQRLDGFFTRKEGNSVQGTLRGSFVVTGGKYGPKNVYRIQVTEGETQVGEDGEMIGPGGMIGIDETGYTQALGDVEAGTVVFVRYEGLQTPGQDPSKENPHIFSVAVAE